MQVETVTAVRYVTPLREGGSLPAIVEADDGVLYAMKFAGAGQGAKALIADLICAELGRALGLRVPRAVFIVLDRSLGPSEPDPEISDLMRASVGLNFGLRFLPHSFAYNPLLRPAPAPEVASSIVWFDAYTTNVDRTTRNTNILVWQRQLWLIDHGAALYFHHDWRDYEERSRSPFSLIRHHVLLRYASQLSAADEQGRAALTPEVIDRVVGMVPDAWLQDDYFADPAEHRQAYARYLKLRLEASQVWVDEARSARSLLV